MNLEVKVGSTLIDFKETLKTNVTNELVNLFNESPEFHEGILRDVQFRVNAVIDREFPKGITYLNKIIGSTIK